MSNLRHVVVWEVNDKGTHPSFVTKTKLLEQMTVLRAMLQEAQQSTVRQAQRRDSLLTSCQWDRRNTAINLLDLKPFTQATIFGVLSSTTTHTAWLVSVFIVYTSCQESGQQPFLNTTFQNHLSMVLSQSLTTEARVSTPIHLCMSPPNNKSYSLV